MSSSNIKEILISFIYTSIILPGEGGDVQDDPSDDPGKAKDNNVTSFIQAMIFFFYPWATLNQESEQTLSSLIIIV